MARMPSAHGQSRVGSRISACAPLAFHSSAVISTIGNEETERLARAGLGGGQYVTAFQSRGNAAGLNRSRDLELVGVEPGDQRRLKERDCENESSK